MSCEKILVIIIIHFFIEIKDFSENQSDTLQLTRVSGRPVIIIPIPEKISSELCRQSNLEMTFDLHKSHPQPTCSMKSLPQTQSSHVETAKSSSKDDASEPTDCKQPLGIELLKKKYTQLDYPTITDVIPKPFCELVLLDINDIRAPVPVTYNIFVDNLNKSQYVYLKGDNGSGKRMLLYHLAKEWAANRILCSFDLVYLILDTTLTSDLLKILQNNRDTSILLLVYGLSWKNADGCFQDILTKTKSFSNVKIIFACDSKLNLPLQCDCYHVVGFSQIDRDNFIDSSFVSTPDDKCQWNMWIRDHPFASALCFRPLYCAMLLHIFKNRQLGDAITNFTSLYRTFLVSIVLKHVSNYDIHANSLSDLTSKDKDFEAFLDYSQKCVESDFNHSPVLVECSKHFGLMNTSALNCSSLLLFSHPSIALFMTALKNYIPKQYSYGANPQHAPSDLCSLLSVWMMPVGSRMFARTFLSSISQEFEAQSPSLFHMYNQCLIGPEMFDPLNWFMYGWCINNNYHHQPHIPQNPDQIRQLAVQMIYQSALHPGSSSPYLTQVINGEVEMLECIKARDQSTTTGIVQKVCIAGNLGSALNDHTINSVFPYVKILIIECEKWIESFNSLTELKYLQDLTIDISPAFANSLPCDHLPYTLKKLPSLRNLTLKRSSTDFLETLFRIFSEDPTITSLKSLCISGSSITSMNLRFLDKKESCLETLVFNDFSMDSSGFELLTKCLLSSNLKKVQLQGTGSIGDVGAIQMANAIETSLSANSDKKLGKYVNEGTTEMETKTTSSACDKKLEVDDTSISGRVISRLTTVIASQDKETKKLSLFLPVKYKYDFHNIQNVFFMKEMPNLILKKNLLLQPPSTYLPSTSLSSPSPPSTSPPSTSPPSTSPPSTSSPSTSPPSTSPPSTSPPSTSPPSTSSPSTSLPSTSPPSTSPPLKRQ